MSEQNNSEIRVNLQEGSFSISGSESFIGANREIIMGYVKNNFTRVINKSPIEAEKNNDIGTVSTNKATNNESIDKYIDAGLYHVDSEDGSISILKKIPGKSNSEKTKNIALIVSYIKKEKILGSSIIPICEKHGCFDSAHHATIFANEKELFVRKGSGKSWAIELTKPGEEAAIDLLEEMLSNAAK